VTALFAGKILFALFSFAITVADIKSGMVPRIAFMIAFPFFFTILMLQAEHLPLFVVFAGILIGLLVFILIFYRSERGSTYININYLTG